MVKSYKIVRFNYKKDTYNEVIKTGLTLQEAQEHCRRADTHKLDKNGDVVWFDGYESEI